MWQSKWALRLGLLSVVLLPLAVIGVRAGLWPFTIGFLIIAVAAIMGVLTVVLALAFVFRRSLAAQRTHLTVAAFLGFSPPLLVAVIVLGAASKPIIHDVATDWQQPLQFDVLLAQRGHNANPIVVDAEVIALQQLHYPELKPIETRLSPVAAAARAQEVAQTLGWRIVASSDSRIEATYTSAMFGFVDDIVVRLSPTPSGSRVDLRSVSRVGKGDLGANAARIYAFIERFNALEQAQ